MVAIQCDVVLLGSSSPGFALLFSSFCLLFVDRACRIAFLFEGASPPTFIVQLVRLVG